jgi:D-glucosaminate-6-phosphate ammonia-lyase
VKRDHAREWKTWLSWLDTISKRVTAIDGVKTTVREPTNLSNKSPSLTIMWDSTRFNIAGEELAEELARTKPRIAVGSGIGGGRGSEPPPPGATGITVTAWQMQPGEDKIVANRLHELLSRRRPPKPAEPAAPAANLSGRWDVDVEFFSSRSQHTLYIEQDGNWIRGSHKGDFSVRDMVGLIEGDKVTLRSVDRQPGNSVTFIFSATLVDGALSGPIHLGEYLTAKFTAKRHAYPAGPTRILVPGGPPIAT